VQTYKNTIMLQDKDIAKIREIETFFSESWTHVDFLSKQLELFHFSKASTIFKSIKKSGIEVWDILKVLLIIPFSNVDTINALYTTKSAPKTDGGKDTYYRLLANQNINWRNILLLFVKQYLKLESKFTQPKDDTKCLIFDDTDIAKTGKTIEGISKVHSHVSHGFIFGFKLFVAGYWNGSVFIPVDFSFHRENKDNKYGLSKKQQKAQKKTKRQKGSPVIKRFKELNSKKNDVLVQMFKRVNQRRIEVNYILIDSWFTTISLINKLQNVNNDVNIIGMYKYNSTMFLDGKEKTIKQLRKSKSKLKRSRLTGFYHMSFVGEINGVTVKIFLTRKGKNGNWHTILSTDTKLSYNKMIKIYNIRWSIEVFFKETKQLLGLGRNQSTNFDAQIAQTTITMIQYLLMSLKFRMEAYETINGLFKDVKQEYIENKLNERLLLVIVELLSVLEIIGVSFDYELTISSLLKYSDSLGFLQNSTNIKNSYKLAS